MAALKRTAAAAPELLRDEDLPAAPVQERSGRSRQRLKTAALDLFRRNGYDATSIEDIAEAAGVSVGSVYLHFRSKRQLLLVLMDELIAALSGFDLTPSPASTPRAVVEGLVGRVLAADFAYVGAHRAWREAARKDSELAARSVELRAWTAQRVTGVLAMLQRLPGARKRVDAPGLATVLDNVFWTLMADAADLTPAERKPMVDAVVHLIYHALFVDTPTPARPSGSAAVRRGRRMPE